MYFGGTNSASVDYFVLPWIVSREFMKSRGIGPVSGCSRPEIGAKARASRFSPSTWA